MQIIEMKAIRSIYYTHKHFVIRNPSTSPVSFSFLSRHFHSSNPRFALNSPESDGTHETTRAWTVFQPLTDKLTTRSSKEKGTNHDIESDSGDEANVDLETQTIYGKDANATLSIGDKTQKGFSDFDNRGPYSPEENADGMSRKKVFSLDELGLRKPAGNKKKGKSKAAWVCENCGYSDGQWWGVCHSCRCSGTMKRLSEGETTSRELEVPETVSRSWLLKDAGDVKPVRLNDVKSGIKKTDFRIPLYGPFGNEVARVLGGGLVPGLVHVHNLSVD